MICNIEKKEIRKAYFDGKLKKLMNTIQAGGESSKEDIEKLGKYLEELEKGDKSFTDKLLSVFNGKFINDEKLPSVEELQGEVVNLSEEWKTKQGLAEDWLNKQYDIIKRIQSGEKEPKNFWGDLSINIIMMQTTLDKIRVYFDQQYHARIIKMMDEFETTRKEAEDRAKLTPQYTEYKNSILLRDRLEQLIINTRQNENNKNNY